MGIVWFFCLGGLGVFFPDIGEKYYQRAATLFYGEFSSGSDVVDRNRLRLNVVNMIQKAVDGIGAFTWRQPGACAADRHDAGRIAVPKRNVAQE